MDGNDGPADADAGVDITRRRRLRAALMQQNDDGLDALGLKNGYQRVRGLGLVQETPSP